jgi:hypothetical protein
MVNLQPQDGSCWSCQLLDVFDKVPTASPHHVGVAIDKELVGPYTPTPAAYVPIPKHKIVIQLLLPGAYSK